MIIKREFYVLIILFLFVACFKEEETTIIINPNNFHHQNISLSQIADSIEYIPLDNQIPVSALYDVKIDEMYLYCATPQGILLYTKTGKFVRRIGKKGRGPEEYINGNLIAISECNRDIIVLDIKKILIYSISGVLKRTISLKSLGSRYGDLEFNQGRIYLAKFFPLEREQQWVVLDTLGQVLTQKINPLKPFSTNSGYKTRLFKFNGGIHYWNHYNDTIYEIGMEYIKPKILFADGSFRIPKEKVIDKTPYFIPLRILETNHFLIIDYVMLKAKHLVIYNKHEKKFFTVSSTKINEKGVFPLGFSNNYDSGIPFRPVDYFSIEKEEYLMCWIDSYRLISIVYSNNFKNSTPLYPEKKKQLEKLANSLDENDNPVLMLVKLKE